jgi:hypothetical protein
MLTGHHLEHFAGHMTRRSDATRRHVDLARIITPKLSL